MRKLSVPMSALALLLLAAGCGGSGNGPLTPAPNPTTNPPAATLRAQQEPLARLIARAAQRSQVLVVSHAAELVAALEGEKSSRQILLEKELGETVVRGGEPLSWAWPSR